MSRASSSDWNMLFRFTNDSSLAAWEQSNERAAWITKGAGLASFSRYDRRSGIEGWFDAAREAKAPPRPPRWKQMVAIALVFYPLSVAANYAISAIPYDLPIWVRVLLSVVLISPVMVYLALPAVTRLLQRWLSQ
ncbi:hypothetical protein [Microbacterium sp. PMB16]|uniref:hypothetical protein n=1 Tax=Microbacterium sp. PMB16 TaxID=3120157 RepID=UPI003F4C2EA9